MRIAFITYEFPPDIAKGGIATYTEQIAKLFAIRGHSIEVFCGSHSRNLSHIVDGYLVHRIFVSDPKDFREKVVAKFIERHDFLNFDAFESPEINANGLLIKRALPNLRMIVKLHTPSFLVVRLNNTYVGGLVKLRFFLGALRRFQFNYWGRIIDKELDVDYQITELADIIVSPSLSLREIISKEWGFSKENIYVIPYPFIPNPSLISLPIDKSVLNTILFVGKLNEHKGLINLIEALPIVVKSFPTVLFKFIGADGNCSKSNMGMEEYMNNKLSSYTDNYEILGALEYEEIIREYGNSEICVFPSVWENFPLVCLEAMSAGCAIVGSENGGMAEMLDGGVGMLVNPMNAKDIAKCLVELLRNPEKRHQLGCLARQKVIKEYSSNDLLEKLEDVFVSHDIQDTDGIKK